MRDAVEWKNDASARTETPGNKFWTGENAPRGTAIAYQLKSNANDLKVSITATATGQVIYNCIGDSTHGMQAGLNRFQWAMAENVGGAGGAGGGGGNLRRRRRWCCCWCRRVRLVLARAAAIRRPRVRRSAAPAVVPAADAAAVAAVADAVAAVAASARASTRSR